MNDGIPTSHYTHPRLTTSHFGIIFLVVFLSNAVAQRADFEVKKNQQNRRFSFSTEAPLTRAINELTPEAIPHIELINQHITRVEGAVLDSLQRERVIHDAVVQPCDPSISRRYRSSVMRAFALRGLLEPAWNCGSDVSGVRMNMEEPGYTLDDLYNAIFSQGASMKRRANEIARRLIDNFTRPEVPFNFTYSTVSARCALTQVCMYRQGDVWSQGFSIHSHGRDDHVRDGSRASIIETARVVDGVLGHNLLFRLPLNDDGSIERVFLENSTTMIQFWRGTPNPSCFRKIPIEENPAVLEALDRVDHSAQQAEDAVTNSNLAILVLPLGLNLVPIVLFAEVSTRTMLLYTLMSDVLTVIPLAIKGVELVIIGANRYRSVVTRVMSPDFMNLPKPLAAGGEIWGAECGVREEVGRTGLVLIIVSVVFLCVGVGGEFAARWYVRKRKKRKLESCSVWNSDLGACGVEERYSFDDSEKKEGSSGAILLGK